MVRPLFLHKTSIIWPCSYLKNSVKLINVLRDAPVVHLTQSQAPKTANYSIWNASVLPHRWPDILRAKAFPYSYFLQINPGQKTLIIKKAVTI